MILGAITAVLGAAAASIGIYLRRELTKSESWSNEEKIAEFTNGYFGVMSGFALFLLGTAGYGLVYSRLSCLVFIYWLFSLTCDILCVLDVVLVMPYTKVNGKYAWDEPICSRNLTTNLPGKNAELCENIGDIATLLIFIPTALLIAFVLSTVTTTIAGAAVCSARGVLAPDKPEIQLAPFSTPKDFQRSNCNNTVWQTDGFRQ